PALARAWQAPAAAEGAASAVHRGVRADPPGAAPHSHGSPQLDVGAACRLARTLHQLGYLTSAAALLLYAALSAPRGAYRAHSTYALRPLLA
ncbi:hypothetical protein OFC58_30325, partial [Escherichia coli]|nr:hypothetical protein [Escherichia coli]